MTSYNDDQPPNHHHHHRHHQYQQQQSFFDELHRDVAAPLPDLCPRDLHVGTSDGYFRLSDDGAVGGRVCAGCMVPICDRHYLSAVGNNWHVSCLVCCQCRQPLDRQSTCYVHDGRIYCRNDYFAFVNLHCLSLLSPSNVTAVVMRSVASVCLSVCPVRALTFELIKPWSRNFILRMWVHF